MRIRWILFFILLSFSFHAVSQKHYTRNLTVDDGLPSNKIRDIYKDSRGFIWIGTTAGLTRYDGKHFKTYTRDDGLAGNRVWSITEDDQGDLWLGCYGDGISKFDGQTFTNYSEKDGLINNNVRKVQYSEKHRGLLIGTVYGFSFLQDNQPASDNPFTSFVDTTLEHKWLQVTSFLETDSVVYLLTYRDNKKYIAFDPDEGSFRYLPEDHRFHSGFPFSTCSFISSSGDTLMGNYLKGVKIYQPDTMLFDNNVGQVFDIAEDKQGNLWMASWNNGTLEKKDDEGGIYKYADGQSHHYNDELGIDTELAWSLYFDRKEKMLWIATLDQGIYLYPLNGMTYEHAKKYNPDNPQFHDIYFDSEGNKWLTVGDKIISDKNDYKTTDKHTLLRKYKAFHAFLHDSTGSCEKYDQLIRLGKYPFDNPYKMHDSIISKGSLYRPRNGFDEQKLTGFFNINEDKQGNIWVNSSAGYYYLSERGRFTPACWSRESSGYFFNERNELCQLTFNFLRKRTNPAKAGVSYGYRRGNMQYRKNTTWSDLPSYEREADKYWIVNNTDGIFCYRDGKMKDFRYLSDTIGLSFESIAVDSLGHKIVGTSTGRIHILKEKNDSLFLKGSIRQTNGLVGTLVNWMVVDSQNRLWAGTNKGLNVVNLNGFYDQDLLAVRNYTAKDGYFDHTSNDAAFNPTKDTLYVLSDQFLTKIPVCFPSEYRREARPKLYINDIMVNYKEYDWSADDEVNHWTNLPTGVPKLEHDQENLIFQFGFKYFRNPENTRYSYKLEGLQDTWTDHSPERKAVFTSLPPNHYKFKVRGYLLSNPQRTVHQEFSFTIVPPWWQTIWFYSIAGLLTVAAVYVLINRRIKRLRREAYIQNRINQLKLEALQSQMNPHFIFNGFNALQAFILDQKTKPALNYLTDFAGLIRKTLDNSRRHRISIEEETDYIRSYIELEKRRMEDLEYHIEISDGIDPVNTFMPPMLVQPLIENSIQHGLRHLTEKTGVVQIRFEKYDEKHIRCMVEDNGIGRNQAKLINERNNSTYQSKSTSITKERLRLIGNQKGVYMNFTDLDDSDGSGGTRVELIIPV